MNFNTPDTNFDTPRASRRKCVSIFNHLGKNDIFPHNVLGVHAPNAETVNEFAII